jgi:hypothetical protein
MSHQVARRPYASLLVFWVTAKGPEELLPGTRFNSSQDRAGDGVAFLEQTSTHGGVCMHVCIHATLPIRVARMTHIIGRRRVK